MTVQTVYRLNLGIKFCKFVARQKGEIFVHLSEPDSCSSIKFAEFLLKLLATHSLICKTVSISATTSSDLLSEANFIVIHFDGMHLSGAQFFAFIWIFMNGFHHFVDVLIQLWSGFVLDLYHQILLFQKRSLHGIILCKIL